MPDLYQLIRPALRCLPAEAAHEITLRALEAGLGGWLSRHRGDDPPILRQQLWGLDLPNPIGLAAGFDKDARVPDALLHLGFGFVEIGTVTPRPQSGNPKPRLFRLEADRAVINRMGFNSEGLDRVAARLAARHRGGGILGANLGRNRDSGDETADYEACVRRLAPLADFLVVNVSSPNTPGLRDLQRRESLAALLRHLVAARDEVRRETPLIVKIAPDLSAQEVGDVAAVAREVAIDGIAVANTTIARPPGLKDRRSGESGGLSGRPLLAPSTGLLSDIYRATGGKIPLVGVGGVAGAGDAYAKICAGASLVELYTALIFAGPGLVARIKEGLAELLRRDGFASVAEAVGSAVR
jgi:dihydroorotate dehydrogenase